MRQTLSLFLLLCLLVGQACADERVTLRLADQKGNMRAQLEAAGALDDLTYDIRWFEFPAAAPLAEALNAGAVDAGIIGDAPLLFALAAGARLKAIAVDKSDPYGTAVLVRGDSPLRSANDLKGQRIATGRGSIGHFVALKALASVGLGEKDVEFRFLGPVDAKMALANGSVDAWATWEPYTRSRRPPTRLGYWSTVAACGLATASSLLPIAHWPTRRNAPCCRTTCNAWPAPSAGRTCTWTSIREAWRRSSASPRTPRACSSNAGACVGRRWMSERSASSRRPPISTRPMD